MQDLNDPALAFSLYASTVATIAISALSKDGKIEPACIEYVAESLASCREFIGENPSLNSHADMLEDILKSA